ncbi:MAG: glycine cleavage system protein GcvH [Candidatus Omnitrophota bacterium]|nr:MAG: glycine cleavage system protein GcvH [Candidatus Omnitrophota bacterium]
MSVMKFTKSHEWVKIEADVAIIGITDYAQEALGDIVFIELPSAGEQIVKSSRLGTVESTKAASEIYAPVSGQVIEVNNEVVDSPQWINESPFGKGWMIKVKVSDQGQLSDLLDEAAYKEFISKETH